MPACAPTACPRPPSPAHLLALVPACPCSRAVARQCAPTHALQHSCLSQGGLSRRRLLKGTRAKCSGHHHMG
eukprot:6209971-Pleurochrysis_carterae.AAC.3